MANKAEYLERLAKAIHHRHGAKAVYLSTEPITETFQGKTVWEGDVEVFSITGHPKAQVCYGWSYQDAGAEHFAAVLQVPPVRTPLDAVRVYIAGEVKKQKAN